MIRMIKSLAAIVSVALGVTLGGCANAQVPMTTAQRERMESHAQDIIPPLIRGVAYDVSRRHAYYSACERREYACDLYRVDFTAAAPRAVAFQRSSTYGYLWPSLSPDGDKLAAVRVRRGERLSDRNENQDLVEIELATGAERVLANAQGGRFTRVEFLAGDLVAVVRTYRSSGAFVCRGDLCTDRGEVLLWERGTLTTLPMRTGENQRDVTFLPLFGRSVWVIVSARYSHIENAQGAYIVDTADNANRRPFATRRDALDFVERERGPIREWESAVVRNGSYWVEEVPFYRQLPLSLVVLDQTRLLHSGLAVGLWKRLGGGFQFQVCRNEGTMPWSCSEREFLAP